MVSGNQRSAAICNLAMFTYHKKNLDGFEPRPLPNEVQVFLLYLPVYPNLEVLSKYIGYLDQEETIRFAKFKSEHKKEEFLISRLLLKHRLSQVIIDTKIQT